MENMNCCMANHWILWYVMGYSSRPYAYLLSRLLWGRPLEGEVVSLQLCRCLSTKPLFGVWNKVTSSESNVRPPFFVGYNENQCELTIYVYNGNICILWLQTKYIKLGDLKSLSLHSKQSYLNINSEFDD